MPALHASDPRRAACRAALPARCHAARACASRDDMRRRRRLHTTATSAIQRHAHSATFIRAASTRCRPPARTCCCVCAIPTKRRSMRRAPAAETARSAAAYVRRSSPPATRCAAPPANEKFRCHTATRHAPMPPVISCDTIAIMLIFHDIAAPNPSLWFSPTLSPDIPPACHPRLFSILRRCQR